MNKYYRTQKGSVIAKIGDKYYFCDKYGAENITDVKAFVTSMINHSTEFSLKDLNKEDFEKTKKDIEKILELAHKDNPDKQAVQEVKKELADREPPKEKDGHEERDPQNEKRKNQDSEIDDTWETVYSDDLDRGITGHIKKGQSKFNQLEKQNTEAEMTYQDFAEDKANREGNISEMDEDDLEAKYGRAIPEKGEIHFSSPSMNEPYRPYNPEDDDDRWVFDDE